MKEIVSLNLVYHINDDLLETYPIEKYPRLYRDGRMKLCAGRYKGIEVDSDGNILSGSAQAIHAVKSDPEFRGFWGCDPLLEEDNDEE